MTIVEGYKMHLYCRNENCVRPRLANNEFAGLTRAECVRQAKEKGWKFSRKDVTCPKCNRTSTEPR